MCISKIFGGGQKQPDYSQYEQPVDDTPSPTEQPKYDETASSSKTKEQKRLRLLAGRKSTIATSGLGLTEEADTQGKKLLGA